MFLKHDKPFRVVQPDGKDKARESTIKARTVAARYLARYLWIGRNDRDKREPEETIVGCIEADIAKLGMVGGFGPRHFAGDTEHHGYRVVPERDERALMLAAATGNVDVAIDENIAGIGHLAPRVLW